MAILTGNPSSLVAGQTSGTITLDFADLIAWLPGVEPYMQEQSNISMVEFRMMDATLFQIGGITFDFPVLTSCFRVSNSALRNTWSVVSVRLRDFDNGMVIIPSSLLTNPAQFNIEITD